MTKAIYPLKKYKGIRYNIFKEIVSRREDEDFYYYYAKIFDDNMRVWYETAAKHQNPHYAVLDARAAIEYIKKGQYTPIANLVDEGKSIRDRELKEHQEFQKEQRKIRRKKL